VCGEREREREREREKALPSLHPLRSVELIIDDTIKFGMKDIDAQRFANRTQARHFVPAPGMIGLC